MAAARGARHGSSARSPDEEAERARQRDRREDAVDEDVANKLEVAVVGKVVDEARVRRLRIREGKTVGGEEAALVLGGDRGELVLLKSAVVEARQGCGVCLKRECGQRVVVMY